MIMVRTIRAGMSNWRTSVAGIATGLCVVLAAVSAALDGDPSTNVDSGQVFEALAGIGMILWGIFSKDGDE